MRLFFGIELIPQVREVLQKAQAEIYEKIGEIIRLTPPENLHLTVKFLGEVPEIRTAEILSLLTAWPATEPAVTMMLRRTGCFPPAGPVRIVWAGLEIAGDSLTRAREAFETACEMLGFPREHSDYSPHITLGRIKNGEISPQERRSIGGIELEGVSQEIRHLTLFQSRLEKSGARYEVIGRSSGI